MTLLARAGRFRGWRDSALFQGFRKWIVLGVLIGIGVGLGTSLFLYAITGMTHLFLGDIAGLSPPLPSGEGSTAVHGASRRWLLPLVVAVGALIAGVLVYWLAPDAEGGGTDAAIRSFHEDAGHVGRRIPPVKLLASSIVLGAGGSAGREGPSAQIGAGVASWIGEALALTTDDRRIACAVGLGAGIGAVFRAPLGGAILGAELLYVRDFEIEAIVPGFIASVIGYSIVSAFYGFTPIFGRGLGLRFEHPITLVWYAVLGVLAGLVALGYARVFYAIRDAFRALPIARWLKPTIGGLCVGLIALAFPQVLSIGYGWVQLAIDGDHAQLATWTMLVLVGVKILATSLTIGSGGSGGDFAPVLYVGGMLGGGLWGALHSHVPGMPSTPAPFVIVGMMALLGGAANAPLAVIIMVAEMTGEFSMLVPAMIAAGLAYLVSGETTLYEEQRLTRADSPAHRGEYTIPLIQTITVGQAARRDVVTADPAESIEIAEGRLHAQGIRGMPVVERGRLVGMFTMTDALRATREQAQTVGDVMQRRLVVAHPAESLHTALQRMTRAGISRLPVVERNAPERLIGIVSMRDLATVLDLEVKALADRDRASPLPQTDDLLTSLLVGDVMQRSVEAVSEQHAVERVANQLAAADAHAAVVVDEDGALSGIVTASDIVRSARDDPARPVAEIMRRTVITTHPQQRVGDALAQPGAEGLRQLLVVEGSGRERRAVGLLRRSDIVAAYLRARDREARITRRARAIDERQPGGAETAEIIVRSGAHAAGRTLAELELPPDVVITRILRRGDVIIPRGSVRLEPEDRLVMFGAPVALRAALRQFEDGQIADAAPGAGAADLSTRDSAGWEE